MSIQEYFKWYILYIPMAIYGFGLVAFLIVLLLLWRRKGKKKGIRYASVFLLVEYVALLLYFTVFVRPETGKHQLLLIPFWSYVEIWKNTSILIEENIMNILVFIPIGFLLATVMRGYTWWKILLVGVFLSIMIEVLQYVLMRGYCETDDVIHNTLGCLVGYGVVRGAIKLGVS